MAIPVNKAFVQQVINDRWGSVAELERGWAERVGDGFQKTGAARDKKTIYRWLKGGMPNDRDSIFGFAATLGIDPLVMLDIESAAIQKILPVEFGLFLANLVSLGKLSALWPLVRPSRHWPSAEISHDFYDARWTTVEFTHPADSISNVYAHLRVIGDPQDDVPHAHRIYYFAYKRKRSRDHLWRPYGIVHKRGRRAICMGHAGDMWEGDDKVPTELRVADDGVIDVETFFGPDACDFKVACLHPFSLTFSAPTKARKALRFP